ncbi:MAG: desulfoferrodoxin FeS4 iron-binding domain-containing protein [Candidatus Gastranaerophilales bacterium]|nr:desulfoferrodoxin FeS4 iron-binding domain-containing protein [Candidatus Gastranaerophilales bacterium]
MTNKLELYKCNICGNVVEVLVAGAGELVCCGEAMKLITPKNSEDDKELTEKHTPVIEFVDENKVQISVENHPMENEHYIMFIESISPDNDEVKIKYFHPNEKAIMVDSSEQNEISARSYCNIHGLYVSNKKGE